MQRGLGIRAIALYGFLQGKWVYFDGSAFTWLELEPGTLIKLTEQPHWVTLRRRYD